MFLDTPSVLVSDAFAAIQWATGDPNSLQRRCGEPSLPMVACGTERIWRRFDSDAVRHATNGRGDRRSKAIRPV